MPTFPITVGNETYNIEAPDIDTAVQTVATLHPDVETPTTAKGVAAQTGASILHGAASLAGLPGTIGDKLQSMLGFGLSDETKALIKKHSDAGEGYRGKGFDPYKSNPFSARGTTEGMSAVTGGYSDRQPENTSEEYARTLGEFLPSAALFGGINPTSLIMGGVVPAVGSETAGQFTRKYISPHVTRPEWMPDWVPSAEDAARIGGALLTPSLVQKAVTPHPTSDIKIGDAKKFDQEGIRYTAGDKTGARDVRLKESELGGDTYDAFREGQKGDFNRAVLKRIGVEADEAMPDVLSGAHKRVSDRFNELASRNNVMPDMPFGRALQDTWDNFKGRIGEANAKGTIIETEIRNLREMMQRQGHITGPQYQSAITRIREGTQGASGDLQIAGGQLRRALDDAMERSIQRTGTPEDLGGFKSVRRDYANLRAIEDTVASGAGGEVGNINPTKLHQVIRQQIGSGQLARGQSDLGELARAGKNMMRELPNTQSGARAALRFGGPAGIGASAGFGLGTMVGGPLIGGPIGAALGGLGSLGAKSLYESAYMSPAMQKYLGNQIVRSGLTKGAKRFMDAKTPVLSPTLLRMLSQSIEAGK